MSHYKKAIMESSDNSRTKRAGNTLHFNRIKKTLLQNADEKTLLAEDLITKVFSEINFERYSIPETRFTAILKNSPTAKEELDATKLMERLAELSAHGLVQKSNGFYGLTKEGREYFSARNLH